MKRIFFFLIILITIAASCTKDKIEIDPNNLVIGIWNFSEYNDNSLVFKRSNAFSDGPCYQFNADGTLLERKNSGWCGTPPVTYADYPGKWTVINDTLIRIEDGYWGGTATYNLDIEAVNSDYFKFQTIWISK
jgi:hypothetical protein